MTGVETRAVDPDEDGIRLDRWFLRHFPSLGHGRLQKLLRTGQIRVEGARAKAGRRLAAGETVRVPPLDETTTGGSAKSPAGPGPGGRPGAKAGAGRSRPSPGAEDAAFVRGLVIYRDDEVLAINKPPGLAVQGGTATYRHLEAMLDALIFDAAERPRLVHRLDKDTSGVMVLSRTRLAAVRIGRAFRRRTTRKVYWALTVGVPRIAAGRIDLPLAKQPGRGGERMAVDEDDGRRAVTLYRVIEASAKRLAWVAYWPQTGRTHQIRIHAAATGTPILGDGKYGGRESHPSWEGLSPRLHLHARSLALPHPSHGGMLYLEAPLPEHMAASWAYFGFDAGFDEDPFAEADV